MQNQQQQKLSRELKVEDALLYLDQVRAKYHSNYEIILFVHMHIYNYRLKWNFRTSHIYTTNFLIS